MMSPFFRNLRRRRARFHVAHHHTFVLALVAHFRALNAVKDAAGVNLVLIAAAVQR